MATQSVSASEFQELVARYEALEKQANGLLSALARGRTIRNLLVLALAALVGVLVYTLYTTGKRLTSPEFLQALSDEGTKRLQKNGGPLEKEARLLYETSGPVLTKAFQERAEKDQPKLVAAAEKEWDPFKAELETRVKARIEDHYKNALGQCKESLEAVAPELKSKPELYKRVEDGLVSGSRAAVEKVLAARVKPGFEKLESNWASYPAAPEPKPGDLSTGEQLIGHLMELLAVAFAHGDALAAIDDSAQKGGAAPKTNSQKKGN